MEGERDIPHHPRTDRKAPEGGCIKTGEPPPSTTSISGAILDVAVTDATDAPPTTPSPTYRPQSTQRRR